MLSPVVITFLARNSYINWLIPHPASFNHEDGSSIILRNVVSYLSRRYWNADIPVLKTLGQCIRPRHSSSG
jgi:hypothetical protein